jgi:hypothetical protein
MLYEFVVLNRDQIIARARERVRGRAWPSVSSHELEYGVPLFLTQLSEALRLEATATPFSSEAIRTTAARHGAELLAAGFKGDDRRLEGLLTSLFGFPASTEWRVLEIGRHRLLALALKVLGVTHKDAIRLFLTLHPALSYPLSVIKALLREMRDVPSPVALALIESVLDVRTLSGEALA